ncbi:WD40 repeat-like protein [Suillus weaverae]|nr:WD40 repeat-like protein [Suillus weaverae]
MALSPNGKTIASGGLDKKVRLWDVETGNLSAKWTGHTGAVRSVCWNIDGERVLSGSDNKTATAWDVL